MVGTQIPILGAIFEYGILLYVKRFKIQPTDESTNSTRCLTETKQKFQGNFKVDVLVGGDKDFCEKWDEKFLYIFLTFIIMFQTFYFLIVLVI